VDTLLSSPSSSEGRQHHQRCIISRASSSSSGQPAAAAAAAAAAARERNVREKREECQREERGMSELANISNNTINTCAHANSHTTTTFCTDLFIATIITVFTATPFITVTCLLQFI